MDGLYFDFVTFPDFLTFPRNVSMLNEISNVYLDFSNSVTFYIWHELSNNKSCYYKSLEIETFTFRTNAI